MSSITRPRDLPALVSVLDRDPSATMVAGATDLMVGINDGRDRPDHVIDVRHVRDLHGWRVEGSRLRIGATTTFRTIERELTGLSPGLAAAARTVGSPQIRARATLGGNVGTASPAGDALPVLVAADADIVLASVAGERRIAARDYFVAPRRTRRDAAECIVAVELPISAPGRQQFIKVGVRNAMVIAVASFALHLDESRQWVGCGLGAVGPTPLSAEDAERLAASWWHTGGATADDVDRFGALVAAAARPIDDHRGTAAYRRRVIGVLATRALRRILEEAPRW